MQSLKATDPSQLGPYRLAGRLGAGGMGVVYLGVSLTADRFAIKVITPGLVGDDEFRERFAAEVEILKTVTGSRVARLERANLDDDPPWLAVMFVPGLSVHRQIEEAGPLETRSGAMLGALIVDGLRSVHEAGLVHRDLKPANIMLGPAGPIVIDFGLARLHERDSHVTATGQPVGTLAYMSPEQARGDRDLTAATDVYALGATLVYALTGHTVYGQASPVALLRRIDDPTDLPDTTGVPAELKSLVDGMLGYEPSTRPSLDEVYRRLVEVATADGVSVEVVRTILAEQTYVEESLELPDWTADPLVDDGDAFTDEEDPTRLVSAPPIREVLEVKTSEQPAPVADVGWLVDEMRTTYARKATL
ncbi:serine/threonine-protein kinase [Krasilnikovia sp. MM14-A1259]|uniref:serine/threonine-protein kinase n=1 Tax=Krasilnikovia sp. MM14-A1259 TaxID=3373539 RepID=UPI00382EACF8